MQSELFDVETVTNERRRQLGELLRECSRLRRRLRASRAQEARRREDLAVGLFDPAASNADTRALHDRVAETVARIESIEAQIDRIYAVLREAWRS